MEALASVAKLPRDLSDYFAEIGRKGGKRAKGAAIKKLHANRTPEERKAAARKAGLASAAARKKKAKAKRKKP